MEPSNHLNSIPGRGELLLTSSEVSAETIEFEKIQKLVDGSQLDLFNREISALPTAIGSLTKLTELDLSANRLVSLPQEIGKLQQLKELNVSNNRLTSLTQEIGNLPQLRKLFIARNCLTFLPHEIGNLQQLERLIVAENRLTSLPHEVGNLQQLENLNVFKNNLTFLPQEIGNLLQLQRLAISRNCLTSLPQEIGNLIELREFIISHNPNLNQLPMSLGECANITHLSIEGTAITEDSVAQILNLTHAKRERGAVEALPERLKMWCGYAGKSNDNLYTLDFVETLTDRQKIDLNEWLVRLAKSREFNKNQSALAASALEMVQSIGESDEWKESFFAQVASNNTACGDRAAQAFNELYTAWCIQNLPENAGLRDKLTLLERAGRTFALREFIANKVSDQNQSELVEVYLFYETKFRERLNLLTAVNSMLYAEIGQRDWIDEAALVKFVEDNALSKMADFEATAKLAETDTGFKEEREAIREAMLDQLEQIGSKTEQDYTDAVNLLTKEKEKAEKALLVKWVNAKLKQPIRGFHAEQA